MVLTTADSRIGREGILRSMSPEREALYRVADLRIARRNAGMAQRRADWLSEAAKNIVEREGVTA